ncbi:hypothetical protein CY34DRAFT_12523 [Suillus luteus UH-Slu-Lm8-n1]|uniref:Uncharacterized protein n=1 Tax=Suillus luteus UH-Slu-Lm8-n1 TaxID=930992 RepID=A0A0D0AK13_9AGAM|nr:hypothetical protein CY34DRAFT_12523 [Suillus luteus UH-Slu-Lm8-n1]
MSMLLPFHKSILEEIHDPATSSDLLVLAHGLGLRREETAIGDELGIMGCRRPELRIVGYEMGKRDSILTRRSQTGPLYNNGNLISVTSRILIVDMLQSDIPTELITGIIVLHAEKVTALSLEAFIPEHITSGMSPLKNIMKKLQLRRVHIYPVGDFLPRSCCSPFSALVALFLILLDPRFHEDVKNTLETRKADVIELYRRLTEPMEAIHHAIVKCITATLSELKRSNKKKSAYFRSFDAVVSRQSDPVWHKVDPQTKQIVGDLATLRRLLTYVFITVIIVFIVPLVSVICHVSSFVVCCPFYTATDLGSPSRYLLSHDALVFHAYLETLVASNTTTATGAAKQHQSTWGRWTALLQKALEDDL